MNSTTVAIASPRGAECEPCRHPSSKGRYEPEEASLKWKAKYRTRTKSATATIMAAPPRPTHAHVHGGMVDTSKTRVVCRTEKKKKRRSDPVPSPARKLATLQDKGGESSATRNGFSKKTRAISWHRRCRTLSKHKHEHEQHHETLERVKKLQISSGKKISSLSSEKHTTPIEQATMLLCSTALDGNYDQLGHTAGQSLDRIFSGILERRKSTQSSVSTPSL